MARAPKKPTKKAAKRPMPFPPAGGPPMGSPPGGAPMFKKGGKVKAKC